MRGRRRGECNGDGSLERGEIVELDDILILHPDASMGGGRTDQVFVIGSMDVDVAVVGIGVLGIEPVEAKDGTKTV